jgi:hypothetical protein
VEQRWPNGGQGSGRVEDLELHRLARDAEQNTALEGQWPEIADQTFGPLVRRAQSIAEEVSAAPAVAILQIANALPRAILPLRRADAERGASTGADVRAATGPTALFDAPHVKDRRFARRNECRSCSDTVLLTALKELALEH